MSSTVQSWQDVYFSVVMKCPLVLTNKLTRCQPNSWEISINSTTNAKDGIVTVSNKLNAASITPAHRTNLARNDYCWGEFFYIIAPTFISGRFENGRFCDCGLNFDLNVSNSSPGIGSLAQVFLRETLLSGMTCRAWLYERIC